MSSSDLSGNIFWTIQTSPFKSLNSFDYLNVLLQRSKEAIKGFNKTQMISIIWDLQEFEEYTPVFYSRNQLIIDSEIKTLKRLMTIELIPHPKSGIRFWVRN